MSAPVRFLFVAVAGWALFRGATAGMLPGVEAFTVAKAEAAAAADRPDAVRADRTGRSRRWPRCRRPSGPMRLPTGPIRRTVPILRRGRFTVPVYYYPATAPARHVTVPRPAAAAPPSRPANAARTSTRRLRRSRNGTWPRSLAASHPRTAAAEFAGALGPAAFHPAGSISTGCSSAPGRYGAAGTRHGLPRQRGTLGGSQAGARLTYAIDPRIAASLRTTTPVGGSSGGEVAAGVRLTPFPSLPFAITAERRAGDRPVRHRPLGLRLVRRGRRLPAAARLEPALDGYAQAGVVGIRSRDLFVDGGAGRDPARVAALLGGHGRVGRLPARPLSRRRRPADIDARRPNVERAPRLAPAARRRRRSPARVPR